MARRRENDGERTGAGRPIPLAALRPPSGGPERLERAVLLARCRDALGAELGLHLVRCRVEDRTAALIFDSRGWAAAARSQVDRIAPRLGGVLGGRRLRFEVLAGEEGPRRPTRLPQPRPAGTEQGRSGRERLERLAGRLACREADGSVRKA